MKWNQQNPQVLNMPDLSQNGESKAVVITDRDTSSLQFVLFVPYDILEGHEKKKIGELLSVVQIKLEETAKSLNTALGANKPKNFFEEFFGKI